MLCDVAREDVASCPTTTRAPSLDLRSVPQRTGADDFRGAQSETCHDHCDEDDNLPKRQFPLGTCSACHCRWSCDVTAHGKSQGNCSTDGGGQFHQIAGHPKSGRAGARAGFGQQHEPGVARCTQRKSPDARCRDRGRADGAASRQRDRDRHDADRPGACGQAVGSHPGVGPSAFRSERSAVDPRHRAVCTARRSDRHQAMLTVMRRGFACSAFGMLSLSTPLESSAETFSGSSSGLSVKVLWNRPRPTSV